MGEEVEINNPSEPELNNITEEDVAEVEVIDTQTSEYIEGLPDTFKVNTPQEKRALKLAENFRQQYAFLYPNRMSLLLAPTNEANTEKVICTYVIPTLIRYVNFFEWQDIANYIRDALTVRPLREPTVLPTQLYSPSSTLKNQSANCFEYSNVLCSLLLGAGYDAYVVSGYATREICTNDLSFDDQPEPASPEPPKPKTPSPQRKYTVKGARDLTSKFEQMMSEREVADGIERAKQEKIRAKKERDANEQPGEDTLWGRRIHSWIVVRPGRREIAKPFFIEPFSGIGFSITDDKFLGVESCWNDFNFWACVQDSSEGVDKIKWDVTDMKTWEPLVGRTKRIDDGTERSPLDDAADEEPFDDLSLPNALPLSWCDHPDIDVLQMEKRAPTGIKIIRYKRCIIEMFSPYVEKDGLVFRQTQFEDREYEKMLSQECRYKRREDCLEERLFDYVQNTVVEKYGSGREDSLKRQTVGIVDRYKPEATREMIFWPDSRPDGLVYLNSTPQSLELHYTGREDKLYFRSVQFEEPGKAKLVAVGEKVRRKIIEIIEKSGRHPEVENADDDIASVRYLLALDKIAFRYHKKNGFVTNSTRIFEKPDNADDKNMNVSFSADMTSTFTAHNGVDVDLAAQARQLPVYQKLIAAIKAETIAIKQVRLIEESIKELLEQLHEEDEAPELKISLRDINRNEKAKTRREYLAHQADLEEKRKKEVEMDYLAPFLAQLGHPKSFTKEDVAKLTRDCLEDCKQRVIEQGKQIQANFDKESQKLKARQIEYQNRQTSMHKEEEEAYRQFCSEAMFRISILKMRLDRHKINAPQKYAKLDQKLKADPRLRVTSD